MSRWIMYQPFLRTTLTFVLGRDTRLTTPSLRHLSPCAANNARAWRSASARETPSTFATRSRNRSSDVRVAFRLCVSPRSSARLSSAVHILDPAVGEPDRERRRAAPLRAAGRTPSAATRIVIGLAAGDALRQRAEGCAVRSSRLLRSETRFSFDDLDKAVFARVDGDRPRRVRGR
jgi:hypothetical protein